MNVLEARGLEAPGALGSQANVFDVGVGASHGSLTVAVLDTPNVVGVQPTGA